VRALSYVWFLRECRSRAIIWVLSAWWMWVCSALNGNIGLGVWRVVIWMLVIRVWVGDGGGGVLARGFG
jgi:hypothetical protein